MDTVSITDLGLMLIVFGFVLALVAMIVFAVRSSRGSGQGRTAGLVLIGPIPIVFGNDRQSMKVLMILAIVLILAVLLLMLLPSLLGR